MVTVSHLRCPEVDPGAVTLRLPIARIPGEALKALALDGGGEARPVTAQACTPASEELLQRLAKGLREL